jgi:uncharacterized protein (TIGR00297 family)
MLDRLSVWLDYNPWLIAIILNTVLLIFAIVIPKKLLTRAGLINAWVLGVVIWANLGWRGYGVVMFYFLVGSAVTKIGMAQKEAQGIAEKRGGARGPENVWGSAFTATICAIGIGGIKLGLLDTGWESLLLLGYVASFATKLSDTTASEVGKAYGKSTFLITTFKPVPRGTEGAISLEGTLAGIVGGILISLVAYSLGMITFTGVIICTIAAFVATNLESVIGATLQSDLDWLSNELVNVINTIIGAVVAISIAILWH